MCEESGNGRLKSRCASNLRGTKGLKCVRSRANSKETDPERARPGKDAAKLIRV